MGRRIPSFSITGPGVERDGYETGQVALSAAITFSQRDAGEAAFYVRDPAGDIWGRVERDATGNALVYRLGESK